MCTVLRSILLLKTLVPEATAVAVGARVTKRDCVDPLVWVKTRCHGVLRQPRLQEVVVVIFGVVVVLRQVTAAAA